MANNAWKIARNRGSAQLPLVIVVALAVVLVLLGKAQTSLFDQARTNVTDWMAPALEKVRAPIADFDRWVGSLGDMLNVYRENLRLKEENARLRQWQNAAVILDDRMKRYQLLLHAVPDPKMDSVLARVIGRSSHPFLETMILDAGKTSNVKPGQAVVDARGMIGRIFLAGQRTSWVILLTDLNSRIPVSIMPGNVQAIMAGDKQHLADARYTFAERDTQTRRAGRQFRRWRTDPAGPSHRHDCRGRQWLPCRAFRRRRFQPGRGNPQFQIRAGDAARALCHRPSRDGCRPCARRARARAGEDRRGA